MTYPTTRDRLRDRAIAVIEALTPSAHAGDRFAHLDVADGDDLEAWAVANAAAAFRRFQVRDTGEDEPPAVTNTDQEERRVTLRVVVAYPHTARAGEGGALDVDDLLEADQYALEQAVGIGGRSNFTGDYDACWRKEGSSTDRVEGEGVDFLVLLVQLSFVWAAP